MFLDGGWGVEKGGSPPFFGLVVVVAPTLPAETLLPDRRGASKPRLDREGILATGGGDANKSSADTF